MSATRDQADFAQIRDHITMEMLFDHYGIRGFKRNGAELRGKCPIHSEDKAPRSFQVNTSKNIFHCFYCKVGGNVIDFVAKMERCNLREAGLKIYDWFLSTTGETGTPPATPTPTQTGNTQPAAHQPDVPLGSPSDQHADPGPETTAFEPSCTEINAVLQDIAESLRAIADAMNPRRRTDREGEREQRIVVRGRFGKETCP
jgi:hypothetical protein